jgi:hypothetical protein
MTMAPQVLPEQPDVVALPEQGTGERRRRRQARQRLAWEQVLVVVIFVVAVITTLVILGAQWLDTGGAAATNGAPIPTLSGGPT